MKKYSPWLIAAAAVGVVVYLARRTVANASLPNLIAGGSFTPQPGSVDLSQQAALATLDRANTQAAAADLLSRGQTLKDAVKKDPGLGLVLGLDKDTVDLILNPLGVQGGTGFTTGRS